MSDTAAVNKSPEGVQKGPEAVKPPNQDKNLDTKNLQQELRAYLKNQEEFKNLTDQELEVLAAELYQRASQMIDSKGSAALKALDNSTQTLNDLGSHGEITPALVESTTLQLQSLQAETAEVQAAAKQQLGLSLDSEKQLVDARAAAWRKLIPSQINPRQAQPEAPSLAATVAREAPATIQTAHQEAVAAPIAPPESAATDAPLELADPKGKNFRPNQRIENPAAVEAPANPAVAKPGAETKPPASNITETRPANKLNTISLDALINPLTLPKKPATFSLRRLFGGQSKIAESAAYINETSDAIDQHLTEIEKTTNKLIDNLSDASTETKAALKKLVADFKKNLQNKVKAAEDFDSVVPEVTAAPVQLESLVNNAIKKINTGTTGSSPVPASAPQPLAPASAPQRQPRTNNVQITPLPSPSGGLPQNVLHRRASTIEPRGRRRALWTESENIHGKKFLVDDENPPNMVGQKIDSDEAERAWFGEESPSPELPTAAPATEAKRTELEQTLQQESKIKKIKEVTFNGVLKYLKGFSNKEVAAATLKELEDLRKKSEQMTLDNFVNEAHSILAKGQKEDSDIRDTLTQLAVTRARREGKESMKKEEDKRAGIDIGTSNTAENESADPKTEAKDTVYDEAIRIQNILIDALPDKVDSKELIALRKDLYVSMLTETSQWEQKIEETPNEKLAEVTEEFKTKFVKTVLENQKLQVDTFIRKTLSGEKTGGASVASRLLSNIEAAGIDFSKKRITAEDFQKILCTSAVEAVQSTKELRGKALTAKKDTQQHELVSPPLDEAPDTEQLGTSEHFSGTVVDGSLENTVVDSPPDLSQDTVVTPRVLEKKVLPSQNEQQFTDNTTPHFANPFDAPRPNNLPKPPTRRTK